MDPQLEHFILFVATLAVPPVFFLVLIIVVLATFGKSLGIRRNYVLLLQKIFEWGRVRLEAAQRKAYYSYTEESDSALDSEDDEMPPPVSRVRRDRKTSTVAAPIITDEVLEATPSRSRNPSGNHNIIVREEHVRMLNKLYNPKSKHEEKIKFKLRLTDDVFDFTKAGVEAIIEDDVTSRFNSEELASWNLLTRNSFGYQFANWRLTLLWIVGFLWRYFVLFPGRLILLAIGLTWLCTSTAVIGYLPDGKLKKQLNWHVSLMCYRILSRCLSGIITFHNRENMAKSGGICVANHTSPIDVMMLACDNCYALVGQRHGGLLGVVQRSLNRASSHIWFERSEAKDRSAVSKRLQDHVEHPDKLPILIFPEGTCINNTSVMMFKKGSFEVGGTIYPVAIKYDPRFGDPFWNSSKVSWLQYMLHMMTSWAIVCDVWYLPPMKLEEGEESVHFANRVKKVIAAKGGLVDLEWDGQLKRYNVPEKLIQKHKELFAKRITTAPESPEVLPENGVRPPCPPDPCPEDSIRVETAASPADESPSTGDLSSSQGVIHQEGENMYPNRDSVQDGLSKRLTKIAEDSEGACQYPDGDTVEQTANNNDLKKND